MDTVKKIYFHQKYVEQLLKYTGAISHYFLQIVTKNNTFVKTKQRKQQKRFLFSNYLESDLSRYKRSIIGDNTKVNGNSGFTKQV